MSEAITDATSGAADAHSFDHVGIVAVDGEGKVSVIEALPKKGVTETPFEEYLSSAPMNFKGADGNFPDFWIELFAEMGQPIPQGEPLLAHQ